MSCCESETLSVVSILGEPRDPRTWTHAPSSIMETIEKLGYPVVGFNSGIRNRYLNTILAKINQLAGPRQIESRRMRLARIICAIKVHRKTRCIKSKTVLHMGTLDLPVFKEDKSTKHYLYCDSTWNLLVKHYPRVGRHAIRASVTMDELERRCYSQMEHIFPASEYVREDLIKHYQIASEKVSVVGMGVGKIQPFMGQKDYRNGHILFAVKHGFEGKGGPLLIKGFEIAQKRNANLKLVVVGGEEYRERLNGVPNVTVTGYIPWNELQDLYNRATLFAMPALYEPWGQVYVEALLCKTPILGLDRNSLPEITNQGKYGILIEQPTPEAIAEGLIQAYRNPDKLEHMGLEGQEHCLNKYNWDNVAKRMIQVIFK